MRKLIVFSVALFVLASDAHAWTKTQVKQSGSCTASPCIVALTSTGANHLLSVGMLADNNAPSLGAPPAGACSLSWVHGPNTPVLGGGNLVIDAYYCLKSNSGITSFSQPVTAIGGTVDVCVWEATLSLTAMALDSGATPAQKITDTTCTACSGVPLTLSGNADFIMVMAGGGGAVSALTGTGFTLDFTTAFSTAYGFGSGLTTGSVTAPATWTTASGATLAYAIAFQETAGGVTVVKRKSPGVF